ncbi:MAG: YihY/virulence factor BrkB family protein [Rhizobiaceae bacterium]
MQRAGKCAKERGRGRHAKRPAGIPWRGWKDIFWRVWSEISEDRIMLIAAGVTFYLLLALFPALAAFVSLYGFVADPKTIADHVAYLGGILPSGGVDIIRGQLQALAEQSGKTLSLGFVFGLLVAFWSANSGIKAINEAMNNANEENEKRSFLRLNLQSLVFTLAAMAVGAFMIVSVGVVPAVLSFLDLGDLTEILVLVFRWPLVLILVGAAISVIYRYGPSREHAQWKWIGWGAGFAALAWLAASLLFSWYLQDFADYNATYGSLGTVIGFMMWTWISVLILLAGAELDSEIEHQAACDTTTDSSEPIGERGAVVADSVGASSDEQPPS